MATGRTGIFRVAPPKAPVYMTSTCLPVTSFHFFPIRDLVLRIAKGGTNRFEREHCLVAVFHGFVSPGSEPCHGTEKIWGYNWIPDVLKVCGK